MLQFLPYALAAYGGYKGYKANKDAGASGLNRILGGITGAAAGYYGGKGLISGGSALNIPGFSAAQSKFTPFTQIPGVSNILPNFMKGQTPNVLQAGQQQMTGFGDTGMPRDTIRSILQQEGVNVGSGSVQQGTDQRNILQKLLMRRKRNPETGELTSDVAYEIDPFKAGTALAVGTYLGGAFDRKPQDVYTPTYNLGVARLAEQRGGFRYIDPATGQEKAFDDIYIPEADPANFGNFQMGPYAVEKTTLKEGGLAEIKKFNTGGINYLPSKVSHDENDSNNYVRASGYVEDGSGKGDKDEDTMLAQLADGEFVTRADGVLGAGILAGGNPNSMRDMREKGAQYFYEQQRRFKRIFDIIEGANGKNSSIN
jgi:hypothetical protein